MWEHSPETKLTSFYQTFYINRGTLIIGQILHFKLNVALTYFQIFVMSNNLLFLVKNTIKNYLVNISIVVIGIY